MRGLGCHSISIQSHDNISLYLKHIIGQSKQNQAAGFLDKGSVRNKSLNSREQGGAQSVSDHIFTLEDVTSIKDMVNKRVAKGTIVAGGSVIGAQSLIWPQYSMRQSLISLN